MLKDTLSGESVDVKISRDEIIKKFDLPERTTKINTILKLQQEQEELLYCICQSSDISKFMIGCEKCDEWYHGDCIGLEEGDAHLIKKWYCLDCIEKYGLKIVYFSNDFQKPISNKKKEKRHRSRDIFPYVRRSGHSCGKCSNCLQNEECGNGYQPLSEQSSNSDHDIENEDNSQMSDCSNNNSVEEQMNSSQEEEGSEEEAPKPKYCKGINCINRSRVNSKYCSDECGLELARLRLSVIIPHRLDECEPIPSFATHLDITKLTEVILQKRDAFEELRRLEGKEKKLNKMIEMSKKLPIIESGNVVEEETRLFCASCGWDYPSRIIMRHMETCFRKVESKSGIEALTKSNSELCRIFCDHYNPVKGTYCMRLRYICPNHFKLPKVEDNEVCGCPVVKPMSSSFFSDIEKFCQKSKKNCNQHCNWESLAISDIDLERQRVWAKISDLVAKESTITNQMKNRTGALGYLLHSTTINKPST